MRFSLGRWLVPVIVLALAFVAVPALALSVPRDSAAVSPSPDESATAPPTVAPSAVDHPGSLPSVSAGRTPPPALTPDADAPVTAPVRPSPRDRATPNADAPVWPSPRAPIAPGPDAPVLVPAPLRPTTPSADAPTPGANGPGETGVTRKLAPIDGVDIRVAESMPPQYFVDVTYGLPSGCARPDGYDAGRAGDRIEIRVYYLMPSDPNVVCTMIYGTGTHNVPLGSDFTAGTTYTVDVNGTTKTFTAQ